MKRIIILIPLLCLLGCGMKILDHRFDRNDIFSHRYNKDKKTKENLHFGPGPGDKSTVDSEKEQKQEKTWWETIFGTK